MQQAELNKILSDHKEWLEDSSKGKRANLTDANLSGTNLSGTNLSGTNLSGADLRWADLRCANLTGADLSGADLRDADLRLADLSGADLSGADLRCANLTGAVSNKYTFIAIYGIGSANRQTLYIPELDVVFCGCFKGTMAEFKLRVASNTKDKHLQAYNNAIEYLEKQAAIYRND